MKSVMKHRFSEVPSVEIPRSRFDRSHGLKTTFDAGWLVPIFVDLAWPGDTFSLKMTGFARMAPSALNNPVMDNMFMETFFFKVPLRILQTNWKKLQGEQIDPGDSIDYTSPQISLNNIANQSLYDYFGLPTQVAAAYTVNNYAGRGYNLIYNDWFRDQNLQDSVTVDLDDGPDSIADYVLLRRGKRHDYFTSCLPWLQKGDAVQLSLGSEANIQGLGINNQTYAGTSGAVYESGASATRTYASYTSTPTDSLILEEDPNNSGYPRLVADLANATASTVNELRQAVQTQRILEKSARAGTRYAEIVQSFFGVTSEDSRLQRPEY
jgi:hypothetical protein